MSGVVRVLCVWVGTLSIWYGWEMPEVVGHGDYARVVGCAGGTSRGVVCGGWAGESGLRCVIVGIY
jgi:hypothetical protein